LTCITTPYAKNPSSLPTIQRYCKSWYRSM
jgi:hypothetical protein